MRNLVSVFCSLILLGIWFFPAFAQQTSSLTVTDYFKLLPDEYLSVVCCDGDKDAYIKKYVRVKDSQNGYMEGRDLEEDPQYQGFRLKVFPAQNGRQILGLYLYSLKWEDYYFLEYKNGKLINVSPATLNYSQDNIYEFPRVGTTIKVYKKKYSSPAKEINVDETVTRGKYLYSLKWRAGQFVKTR